MMAALPILFDGKESESQRMASNGMALAFLVVISARGPSLGAAKESITQLALHRPDFSQTAPLLPPTAF
jgi:hypothetical protein